MLTHLAFYSGWPNAWAAFGIMKQVYIEDDKPAAINTKEEFEKVNIFGLGKPNTAYAKYFIGNSYLNALTKAGASFQMLHLNLLAEITGIYTMQ